MRTVKDGEIITVGGINYMFDRVSAKFYNLLVEKKTGRRMLIHMMRADLPVAGAPTGDDLKVEHVQRAVDGVAIL